MLKPTAVRPGDRIAIVAPASPFKRDDFELGVAEIERLGFRPGFDDRVFARRGFRAVHGMVLNDSNCPDELRQDANQAVDQASLEMAQAFGIHYLVRSETKGSVYSAATMAGIPSILTESGGQGIWKGQ